MPSPSRQLPNPEELCGDFISTSLEDLDYLWPLLDQANLTTETADHHEPSFLGSSIEKGNVIYQKDLQGSSFSSGVQVADQNPWLIAQECSIAPPPFEHNLSVATALPEDAIIVNNPEPLLPNRQIDPLEKGKRKLDGELTGETSPGKWREKGQKLKSLQISEYQHDSEEGSVAKKQDHNAKERVRRMKLNASYSALGNLLPQSRRLKKRWSAPAIIDKMLDYIPELKKEVEDLNDEKENIQSVVDNRKSVENKNTSSETVEDQSDSTTVSLHEVSGREELIVQVCMKKKDVKEEEDNLFSSLVGNLEAEGLLLLSASMTNVGDDRVCYHLHIQMNESSSHGTDYISTFKEKVTSWLNISAARYRGA